MERENSIIDSLLFLYLMKDRQRFPQKKLIKLIFLSELEMDKNNLIGFNFNFIRYRYGPYSFEIPGIQDYLRNNGIIKSIIFDFSFFKSYNSYLNPYGLILLQEFEELFKLNNKIVKKIGLILDKFINFSGKALENYCYNLEINDVNIRDMTFYTTLLNPKKDSENKEKFYIDSDWIETFLLLLDKKNYKQINKAIAINKSSFPVRYPLKIK